MQDVVLNNPLPAEYVIARLSQRAPATSCREATPVADLCRRHPRDGPRQSLPSKASLGKQLGVGVDDTLSEGAFKSLQEACGVELRSRLGAHFHSPRVLPNQLSD